MVDESPEKGPKTPWGSLRGLRVSSPVLIIAVVTFRLSNPSIFGLGVEVLTTRLGAAETATAEAARATGEEKSRATKAARVAGGAT